MAKLFDRAEEETKWRSMKEDMNDLVSRVDEAIKSARMIEWRQFSDAVATIEAGIKEMRGAIGER